MQVGAMRLVFAGVSLIPLGLSRWGQVKARDWRYLLAVSALGNGLPAFLFTIAQTQLSSSLTGALNSLVPLFALLIGALVFGKQPTRYQQTGVGIGLAGALLLIFLGSGQPLGHVNSFALLVVLATLCYASSATIIKSRLQAYSSLTITSSSIPVLVAPALLYLLFAEPLRTPASQDVWMSLGAVFTLGFVGTALALLLFYHLIGSTNALFATSVTYLIPVVALFWGWLDGEWIAPAQIIGMFTILGGVYLIHRSNAS